MGKKMVTTIFGKIYIEMLNFCVLGSSNLRFTQYPKIFRNCDGTFDMKHVSNNITYNFLVCVFSSGRYIYHVNAYCQQKSEAGVESPGTGVMGG